MRGIVLSDLHIGKSFSTGIQSLQAVNRRIGTLDYIILNGDILEGPNIPARNEGCAKRIISDNLILLTGFIQNAAEQSPGIKIVYIQGNHDSLSYIDEKLRRIAEHFSGNFQYEPNHFRLGDALFLHGDMHVTLPSVHREHVAAAMRYRLGGPSFINPGTVDRYSADTAPDSRFKDLSIVHTTPLAHISHEFKGLVAPHIMSPTLFPIDLMAAAILETFRRNDPVTLEGVKHIFIGHVHYDTHKPYEIDGVEFRISGPAVRGVSCVSYEFEQEENRLTDIHRISCYAPRAKSSGKTMALAR